MNAYELAEKLEWHWDNDCRSPAISKSADMLRQQADRIAELEETIGACYAVQKMQAEEVYKGNDRIAELQKQLEEKNKPPTKPDTLMESQTVKFWGNLKNQCHGYTTPQTKPLSDEEIAKEWSKFYPDVFHTHLIDFARAIEERHGIK